MSLLHPSVFTIPCRDRSVRRSLQVKLGLGVHSSTTTQQYCRRSSTHSTRPTNPPCTSAHQDVQQQYACSLTQMLCSGTYKMREYEKNAQAQQDIAFPAMMEIGTSTSPGDTAVFIDTTASSHMVTAESRLCQHVVNTTACSVSIKGSCGVSSATSKGKLAFRLRNERGELYRSTWEC